MPFLCLLVIYINLTLLQCLALDLPALSAFSDLNDPGPGYVVLVLLSLRLGTSCLVL